MSPQRCTRCPTPSFQTVFVRSTKNVVYRSKDEGKNWEKQNWKMEKSGSEDDGPLTRAYRSAPHTQCTRRTLHSVRVRLRHPFTADPRDTSPRASRSPTMPAHATWRVREV